MYRARISPWHSHSWKPSGKLNVHRVREKLSVEGEAEDTAAKE